MPNSNDFSTEHSGKLSKNTSVISNLFSTMATNKSGNTPSEAQSSSNSTKNTENSLIKHQGQKWHQVFDFDKMIKQIRATVSEKQHHRNKGDSSSSSNNGKNAATNAAASSSKSNGSSNSKSARSIRQVQRLSGNDMHYYGIVPKKASADIIVCSICRGIYTMVGFNNHMIMQHPSAWGAVSSKLANAPASNDMINFISNDNSQDCLRDGSGLSAPTEILGSPSDLSGIMSTSSNASSSSSSISTTSSTYTATPRHKSSKSGGTTAGSSSSGGSSSTSGSRSRSKQSRHSSSNNHAASVGIHTSSNASTESAQASSKSSKKNSSNSSGSNANSHKNENANNPPSAITGTSTTISNAVTHSGKHSKDTGVLDTLATTPIALYSSSSNSSCSLPPTPKLSTSLVEVKSPAFVAQESVDSSVSSSSLEYEHISSGGKSVSGKPSHTSNALGKNSKANGNPASSSTHTSKEAAKVAAIKDINRFDTTPLTELDQAVSSITENPSLIDKKTGGCIKNIMDSTNISMPPTINNIFQMPTTTTNTENNNEKLLQAAMNAPTTNATNMNVVQTVLAPSYVVPQEVAQTCEDALPHNTSDDNSILTFDDMFDSKFINEILSTADTEIHFDENELDTATAAQQQHQQQQQTQDQHQVFQQQVQPTTKRMRYDETLLTSGQQQIQHQQQGQGVEITGEFVAYQQQQQQQQQYVPYNVATLDDLKLFNGSGPLVEQHHLQHATEQQQQQQQQQQQLTAIDAMQLQQLLYQQQTLNNHYDTNMVDNSADPNALAMHQQQYDHSGVVSAKQLMDICASVDMKSNKLTDFSTLPPATGGAYENCYDNMTAHFQLYNIPSLTDDNVDTVVEQVPTTGGDASLLLPNVVNGMQRTTQQYVLPGGVGEDHLIYEITDNNQVAVISQQRQQQMLNEFLTQANYDQVATDINDSANAAGALMQQNNNVDNITAKEASADIDDDLLDFDYSLLDTFKTISNSSSASNSGGNSKIIKTELNSSGSSSSKYYEDVYLNAYVYSGIPKPIAMNCFGLIKMPFAAATTFRKHILNARKANNSPITLSGGGGINGIVCSNSAATARLSNNSKSMQNYFSNLNSSSNSLVGSEFSIGSITITNSSVSQSQLYAAQQKQQNASNSNSSNAGIGGSMEVTFNTNSNGCGSAMSPVSSQQRSRSKSGNSTSSGGGATLVRSKSQTGAPVAVVTPTSRLPPPPRPSTAGPVLAQNSKTIFVSNTPGNSGERIKFIKRCMPLISSNNNNTGVRNDGSKRPKFSPRQIADLLGGISTNNSKSGGNSNKTLATQPTNDAVNNGPSNNNIHEAAATGNNNTNSTANATTNADERLKLERVAHFYERRRKLYDLARNNSRQQQQQQKQQEPQRTQQPHVQQNLLKQQQQQLFKMLTDYGQLNAAVGCKSSNATPNSNNNGGNEVLRISV